jgi:N-acetylneuraminate synthase
MTTISIAGRAIGPGLPAYLIAELSANHNQNFEEAVRLVHAAKDCGADAVKLQTYTPDTITIDSNAQPFRIGAGTVWAGRTLYDLYAEAYTPWDWQPKLKAIANSLGMACFSSPFDTTAVEFLEGMDVPAYKIASFELVDLPLIERVARTGKPVIISTGMANIQEITEAVTCVRATGNTQIALLKCTSAYPAPPGEMNLRTILDMASRFKTPVGLSDHTLGIGVPVVAVSLGACIVEKHFTLSRDIVGPDSSFSLEPQEFKEMVTAIRNAEVAMGDVAYQTSEREQASRVFRRSLFVVKDLKAGEAFTRENLRSIRPGYGLSPKHLSGVLGRRAATDLKRGTPLQWGHVSTSGEPE